MAGGKRKFEEEPQQPGILSKIWSFFWAPSHSESVMPYYQPHEVEIKILNCNFSKGLRAEIFRICINNFAHYNESVNNSFLWTASSLEEGTFDLTVKVKTIDMLKARMIINNIKELATMRRLTIASVSLVACARQFSPNWVEISDYQNSGICPEYTPTPSVLSVQKCHLTEEVQLRMIEDPAKSYIIDALILEKFHLAPRHKYKKDVNNPMNIIYITHTLHFPLENSEIRLNDSVSVPKIFLSLAKEDFPGRYANDLVSKDFYGVPTQMTEVFLVLHFRVHDELYLNSVLDLLKPGSRRDGDVLITSVLIRHEYESLADFERFVRENKKYSTDLWRKAPAVESLGDVDEYVLQEEDTGESELVL